MLNKLIKRIEDAIKLNPGSSAESIRYRLNVDSELFYSAFAKAKWKQVKENDTYYYYEKNQ